MTMVINELTTSVKFLCNLTMEITPWFSNEIINMCCVNNIHKCYIYIVTDFVTPFSDCELYSRLTEWEMAMFE